MATKTKCGRVLYKQTQSLQIFGFIRLGAEEIFLSPALGTAPVLFLFPF
jgi:hypothetical protein